MRADLAEDAQVDGSGDLTVKSSVRRLASSFGVSKDTAARAVRRLVAAGVVERISQDHGENRRFRPARYRLTTERAAGTSRLIESRARRRPHSSSAQPVLFELDGTPPQ